MFGYLGYFYYEVARAKVHVQESDAHVSNQMLDAMNQYAMVISWLSALVSLALLLVHLIGMCSDISQFKTTLEKSVRPLSLSVIFQLLAIYVIGNAQDIPRYINRKDDENSTESVIAGVVTLLSCFTLYMIKNVDALPSDDKHTSSAHFTSAALILSGWIYNLARHHFIGPWYEAFTVMLACVLMNLGFGVAGDNTKISSKIRSGLNLVFHVFIVYFLAKYVGEDADRVVALGLSIASAVLSVSSHAELPEDRVNAKMAEIPLASATLRLIHIVVASMAIYAVHDMDKEPLLLSFAWVGAILKLVSSVVIPVSQLEFLGRNGSTLILLISFASLYNVLDTVGMVAFWLSVAARALDAFQNTVIRTKNVSLEKEIQASLGVPPKATWDNPMVTVVGIGLVVASVFLVIGGNEKCSDAILNSSQECHDITSSQARSLRVAIGFTWAHALTGLIGILLTTFRTVEAPSGLLEDDDVPNLCNLCRAQFFSPKDLLGFFTPSTSEMFRTIVATTVLVLVAMVAHEVDVSKLYLSLFTYLFVDMLGRNVV